MTAEARLLVLERVGDARATDAHMWVCLGGRKEATRPSRGYLETPASSHDGDALVAVEFERRQVKQGGLG